MSYQVLKNNENSTTAATIDAAVTNSWVRAWMEICVKIYPKDKLKEETWQRSSDFFERQYKEGNMFVYIQQTLAICVVGAKMLVV